jgi:hypothetical protein
MPSSANVLKRAQDHIEAGRLWRAKEILRGTIASSPETAILEAYGRLLERLGDRLEAGKYLYLSGARTPQDEDAIALFTQRHVNRRGKDFIALFPAAVRRLRFETLPDAVQDDFRARGVTPSMLGPPLERQKLPPARMRIWQSAIAIAIVAMFLLALALGFWTMLSWLGRLAAR